MTKRLSSLPLIALGLSCLPLVLPRLAAARPAPASSASSASAAAPLSSASAPSGAEPSAEEQARRQEAKRRFLRGVDLVQREQWDAALAEFLASRELHATRVAIRNAAECLHQLNRNAEALEMYNELLQKHGDSMSAEDATSAGDAITQLRKLVGSLTVAVEPAGAVVIVDGRERGIAPLPRPIVVDPGTHSVKVFKEGFLSQDTQILVAGGQTKTVNATLKVLSESGRLTVNERDGKVLDVVVDGAVVGKTPWSGALGVGTHVVFLRGAEDLGSPPSAASVQSGKTISLTLVATKLDTEIRVEPTPSGARVDIDGVTVGNGAWGGRLTSGAHRVEVSAEGFLSWSREVRVAPNQREVLRVSLERDLTDPRWKSAFRPHLYVEALGGMAWSPSFGGSADAACAGGDCSERSRPMGWLAGARGGFQVTQGLGVELFLGYLSASESMTRKQTARGDFAMASEDYRDTTKISGPLAALSASYQFFEKTPLLFRLWAGAARVKASFTNEGTFSGTAIQNEDPSTAVPFSVKLSVPEHATRLWMPLVGPEVRFGYRFSKSFAIDAGVAMFLLFPPETLRSGTSAKEQDSGTRNAYPADIPAGFADGAPIRLGIVKLARDNGFGTSLMVVPTVGARLDF